MCVCESVGERGVMAVWQLCASATEKYSTCLTLSVSCFLSHVSCLTPITEAHVANTYSRAPVGTCQRRTLATVALPTAAARALKHMVSKYSRNQADNETRYPLPSMPCAGSSQGLLLPTQEMHYWETFSLTLSLPLILLFLPDPRSASRRGEMPTSPQKPGRVPSPFMQMLNHKPGSHIHSVPPTITYSSLSFIYSFHLLLCTTSLSPALTLVFPFPVACNVVELQPSLPLPFAASPLCFHQSPVLSLSQLLSIF